jgi:secretion/DNA translocation related TadE-like protein
MTSERGSMTVLVAAVVAIVALLALGVGEVGRVVALRQTAQTAADAAALGAAPVTFLGPASPEAEARRLAAENGATLIGCTCTFDPVWRARTVVVRVAVDAGLGWLGIHTVNAEAAAEFDPTVWLEVP